MVSISPRCRFRFLTAALLSFVLAALPSCFAQTGEVKERHEIDDRYKWNLTHIYKTDAECEADLAAVEAALPDLAAFEGRISQSPRDLLDYLALSESVYRKYENALVYAGMSNDQDTREQKYAALQERVGALGTRLGEATSWFSPELVSVSAETYEQWYAQEPALALYRHSINDALRTRKHTLSPAEERIMALSGDLARCPQNTNEAFRNSDIKFPAIKNENGEDVTISEARMRTLLESPDGTVRRAASMNLLETYAGFQNTAAALMSGNIAGDIFYARARGYNSCLHASLDADNIDTTVFLNLIETVKNNSGALQRYVDLRRRALGLDEIHLYDMSVPIVAEMRMEVPYDEAVATVKTAFAPLGTDYVAAMSQGVDGGGWVDVYENQGKYQGMYSWSSYESHPYVLCNWNETLDDMFGLAHELGHAMHSYYTHKTQPYAYGDYTLFVAEVASTFNEALLMDHLLKKEKDPAKRLHLVNQYIDNIRGTVITQVMFADFELRMHRAAEAGQPLNSEALSEMYAETMRDYYGTSAVIDSQYAHTWIRIPHFYRNFYVYKYATGFISAEALSQKVLKKEKGARDRYLNFLSSGSSKYSLDLLRDAGVDLNTPAPAAATMKKLGELVDEMEKLLKQTKRI